MQHINLESVLETIHELEDSILNGTGAPNDEMRADNLLGYCAVLKNQLGINDDYEE